MKPANTNLLLSQISSSLGGNYLSAAQYNALDLPSRYTVGNGPTAQTHFTYFGIDIAGSPYAALRKITLQHLTDPLLVDRLTAYDPVGNPTKITDNVNSEVITYGYDDLDRLISVGAPLDESYQYLPIGNLNLKNDIGFTYDPNHKHAVSSYNGTSYGYDANGNLTSRGNQTIKYDTENRPVRLDVDGTSSAPGTTIARFAYDGDGTRRKRLDANGTIHYLGSYERNVGTNQNQIDVTTKYYTATLGKVSRLIAFRKGGTLYYVGTDHLGGTIRVADATFVPLDQMRYAAYGASRDAGSNLNTDHLFTGQTQDAAIGLYWYQSRAYDPAIGRFTQPDTVVPDPKNPQALNRYAYGLNSPVRMKDPSGHRVSDGGNVGVLPSNPLDYSLDLLNYMGWQQRQEWLAQFQEQYGTGGWFNNVDGILDYFSNSSTFSNSQYMHLADAGVLKAIEDGKAASLHYRELPGGNEHDAAVKWQAFFDAQQDPSTSFGSLSHRWGAAEQAGVQYGTGLMAPRAGREAAVNTAFVAAGDTYRFVVTNGVSSYVTAGLHAYAVTAYPFDPRRDATFVDASGRAVEDLLSLAAIDPALSPWLGY
ncbi:MAG TPA: RHS repeat-associated core domain-containing protein [Chloroflexota bacterium]|nr:RHS repeat-associated core domain-containing protein [Chloroflexota bacterium]